MRFRSFHRVPIFEAIARLGSFSAAADEVGLTKGAVSYQIKQLEAELGFPVFQRLARGIQLTAQGADLLSTARSALETIERKIEHLRKAEDRILTIGVTTYFASRWLSPRLMEFMLMHPGVRLRIQPMIDLLNL
ncbi:MAG: LysR family transcriptional regulator, partial [Rhizobiales bacterium]|nr:LysR family transcriptional regulator [Hyphomicrobiales bacterium]